MSLVSRLKHLARPFLSRHREAFLDFERPEERPAVRERHHAPRRERRLGGFELKQHRQRPQKAVRQREVLRRRARGVVAHEAFEGTESARGQQEQVARGARVHVEHRQASRSRLCFASRL